MYIETMTVNEKIKELTLATDKLFEVGNRVAERYQNKLKKGEYKDLGTRRLVINGTEYFYILSVAKAKNRINGDRKYETRMITYTIQTHSKNGLKYVVCFHCINGITQISEYEYHVFVRYRERFLDNDHSLSLDNYCIETFLKRNKHGIIRLTEEGFINIVPDGILLGTINDPRLFNYKTFIVEEQLREDQKLWSKYSEPWLSATQEFNDIKNDPYLIKRIPFIKKEFQTGTKLIQDYLQKRENK